MLPIVILRCLLCSIVFFVAPAAAQPPIKGEIPYYFIAVHNEPYNHPGGEELIAMRYRTLRRMVNKAGRDRVKLTLMFSAQWAQYITVSSDRRQEVLSWQQQGHEIGFHHHSIFHEKWDGYSDFDAGIIWVVRMTLAGRVEGYLGGLDQYSGILQTLNPTMASGCANDEDDKRALPSIASYDTCSGWANFGPLKTELQDGTPTKGINEYITTGVYNGRQRFWLAHAQLGSPILQRQGRIVFESMSHGVYGAVFHSDEREELQFVDYLNFLHAKDPLAERSKTVSAIIEEDLLPQCFVKGL